VSTFNWKQSTALQNQSNPLARISQRPNPVDLTEQWVVNDALAIGVYDGTYPGLKLASALAFPVVSVPVSFMGMPTPVSKSKNEAAQKALTKILLEAETFLQKVFILRRVVGTAWGYPNWDAKRGRIYHELIPNSSVTDIIRDLTTGETIQIIVNEQLTVMSGENRQRVVNRKRFFTPQTVRTEYTGDVPPELKNQTVRNTAGVMPVAFANDVIDNSKRGKSVYTRLISHLKNYHDVMLKWSTVLAQFNVKWVQEIEANLTDWLGQNPGLQSGANIDTNGVDFIVNKMDKEKTSFIFPGEAVTTAHKELLALIGDMVVIGSGVPEMAFGKVATGNHASTEEQMTTLANTVMDDQNQIDEPLHEYIAACLRLEAGATMQGLDPEFDLPWNDLDVVSQETASKIQANLAEAYERLTNKASVPLETRHAFSLRVWPKMTEPDFEKWKASLGVAGKFNQFQSASLTDALDVAGEDWDAADGV